MIASTCPCPATPQALMVVSPDYNPRNFYGEDKPGEADMKIANNAVSQGLVVAEAANGNGGEGCSQAEPQLCLHTEAQPGSYGSQRFESQVDSVELLHVIGACTVFERGCVLIAPWGCVLIAPCEAWTGPASRLSHRNGVRNFCAPAAGLTPLCRLGSALGACLWCWSSHSRMWSWTQVGD